MDIITSTLTNDLAEAYPDARIRESDSVWRILTKIHEYHNREKFIFVLDEWDYIFYKGFVTDGDKEDYIDFLRNLLKDKAYVELAYMTGNLPIAIPNGTELNMFCDYTMATETRFSECFGFLDSEVDDLYARYLICQPNDRQVTREGLRTWYGGYHTITGKRVYNPYFVVSALENNNLQGY